MATVEAVREAQQFIGGEWVDAAGGETFDVTDPFTGEVVVRAPASDARRCRARGRSGSRGASRPGRRPLRPSGSASS